MISVVIPACNEERYILETLDCIPSYCEVVVVCNGCTDKTFDLVKERVDKVLNFKWRSISRAKNEGAKVAKGSMLVFLDADTLVSEKILNEIKNYETFGVVGSCRVRPSCRRFRHKLMFGLKNIFVSPFNGTNGITFCTRETFDSVKGFDEDVFKREDRFFVNAVCRNGKHVLLKGYVVTSTRRFDNKGYLRMLVYWIKEVLRPTKEEYEVVR